MALAQDALTAPVGTAGGTSTIEGTHTPSGTPKGVLVFIASRGATGADQVSGVTYGGVTMERVEFKGVTTAQTGSSYIYFLASPPTGAQTVKVTVSGATKKYVACVTITATGSVAVDAHGGLGEAGVTNPSITLATTASTETIIYGVTFSGEEASGVTPGTGYTQVYEVAIESEGSGAMTDNVMRKTVNGTGGNIAVSWTWNNDSCAACAVAVKEVVAAGKAPPFAPRTQRNSLLRR
jgi:hypothetical protein